MMQAEAHDSRSKALGGPTAARPIVHVVDADDEVRHRVCQVLAAAGIKAKAYADVGRFLSSDGADAPGCLLVDARLARIDLLEHPAPMLRPAGQQPVVMTGGEADVATVVWAMKAGAIDFLEKPLREQDVVAAVSAAIQLDRERRCAASRLAKLRSRFQTLTARERQVMTLVTAGMTNKHVARELGLCEITVKVHRGAAMRKMEAGSLADLVRMADALAPGMAA